MRFLLFAIFILHSVFCISADWPQWRGPEGRGISQEKNLPLEWSATENIQWKTSIPGRGHSSPIVWGNRIFLTTSIEGPLAPGAKAIVHKVNNKDFLHPDSMGADHSHTFKVLALASDTGRILWERTAYEGTVYDNRHRKSSYASPTPVTDGRSVFAFFGTEGIYSYDFKGKLLWKASLGKLPALGLGAGSSPVLFGKLVILQCDEDNGQASFIIALDKKTGKQVWKTPRTLPPVGPQEADLQLSWSTPVLIGTAGRTELVTSSSFLVIAYDPATGRELWRADGVKSNAIHTPVFGNGIVYVTAGFPAKRTLAFRTGADAADLLWKYEKGTAYVASPILYENYLYLLTDKGILTCLDAKTGEVKYDSGRVPVPASFTASPVAFEGKILLTSEDGDTFVVKAGPVHEVLRTNSLGEPVYASPALAGGSIYIRGERHLYRISKKS